MWLGRSHLGRANFSGNLFSAAQSASNSSTLTWASNHLYFYNVCVRVHVCVRAHLCLRKTCLSTCFYLMNVFRVEGLLGRLFLVGWSFVWIVFWELALEPSQAAVAPLQRPSLCGFVLLALKVLADQSPKKGALKPVTGVLGGGIERSVFF